MASIEHIAENAFLDEDADLAELAELTEIAGIEGIEQIERIEEFEKIAERKTKVYKYRNHPMQIYTDQNFRVKYRLSKKVASELINLLTTQPQNNSKQGGRIPFDIQVLIALRCWGRAQVCIDSCVMRELVQIIDITIILYFQIQDDTADLHGVSQQSITNICRRVAHVLVKLTTFIKMPAGNEEMQVMNDFEKISGFRNV